MMMAVVVVVAVMMMVSSYSETLRLSTFQRTARGGTDFEHFAPILSTFDTPNTHFPRTHSERDNTADTERHQIDKREEMELLWLELQDQ